MIGFAYQGCAPAGGYRLAEEQEEVAIPLFSNSFEAAWKKNTFVLGPGSSRRLGSFPMPGGDRGDGGFPLTVQATLMDSALVEAGIKEFAGLAGIDSTSFNAYRAIYLKRHSIDGCVLVYVDIQTFLAEDYLEADRWVFFVEDEHRNQVEPIRIVQHPVQRQAPRPGSPYGAGSRVGLGPLKRVLELFFPLKHLPQMRNSIEGFRSLKLVVLQINNSQVRAEGGWNQD
ncbi:MAG: hypothetical protein HW389_3435 [Bacteroidetes bacterium]|nr:hypothetical protein [Bacteroidota bacterium]